MHVRESERWTFQKTAFVVLIAFLIASVTLNLLIQVGGFSDVTNAWLWVGFALSLVFAVFGLLGSMLWIFQPTDLAIKIRIKQFTKKIYRGRMGIAIPKLERYLIYDSRVQTIWMRFTGVRGANRNQMKDMDNYKKRVLTVDESIYWVENPEEKFKSSDFHEFGALVTAGREELNMLCSINYKIIEPNKLSKIFDQLENSDTEKSKFKGPLVTKVASALRSTIARMTLDEVFEERQKLMELLIRDCADVKDNWGLEVASVSIEEMWLEDEKLQEMLDERKKYEIIGDAAQIREEHEAEMRTLIIRSEEEAKTMLSKAKDEARIIVQRTQQDVALLQQELMKLQAEIDIMSVDAQAKAKVFIAEAQAQRKKMLDEVTDEKILLHEFIKVLPQLVEQISSDEGQKFTLVPDKKHGLMTAGIFGVQSESNQEEED